jgi:hypothetical protein
MTATTPRAGRSSSLQRRWRHSGSCGDTTRTTSGADHEVRAQARGDRESRGDPAAHGVLRLDGLGGLDLEARTRLHVHQQLAAGAARGERADGRGGCVERLVHGRPARGHRVALRRLRSVELPWVAGVASALRAHDGRGGYQALLQRAEDEFGKPESLRDRVYSSPNPVAEEIWAIAAREVAQTATAALGQVFAPDAPVSVSWSGNLFNARDLMLQPFLQQVEWRGTARLPEPASHVRRSAARVRELAFPLLTPDRKEAHA